MAHQVRVPQSYRVELGAVAIRPYRLDEILAVGSPTQRFRANGADFGHAVFCHYFFERFNTGNSPPERLGADKGQSVLPQANVLPLLEKHVELAIVLNFGNEQVESVRSAIYNAKTHTGGDCFIYLVPLFCLITLTVHSLNHR